MWEEMAKKKKHSWFALELQPSSQYFSTTSFLSLPTIPNLNIRGLNCWGSEFCSVSLCYEFDLPKFSVSLRGLQKTLFFCLFKSCGNLECNRPISSGSVWGSETGIIMNISRISFTAHLKSPSDWSGGGCLNKNRITIRFHL